MSLFYYRNKHFTMCYIIWNLQPSIFAIHYKGKKSAPGAFKHSNNHK